MTKFTEDNTEGFTPADLEVLNTAYAALMQDRAFEDDTHALGDSLNNAWVTGDTVETLVARYRARHPAA